MTPRPTIEQLLEMPAADIEKMSDAELERHLARYFPHTRPAGALPSALAVGVNKQEANADDPFIAKRLAAIAARKANTPTKP